MPLRFYKASSPLIPYQGKYEQPTARKKIVFFCLIAALTQTGCAGFRSCGSGDPWLGPDKVKHFTASAVIGAGATALASTQADTGESVAIGWTTATAAGAAKEWHDLYIKKTCFSWRDLVWDMIGASVGVTIGTWAVD